MYKTYAIGARKLNKNRKYRSIQPEVDARKIKQTDITRNGPQPPSGTPLPLPITVFWAGYALFISFLSLESNKKT